MDHQFLTDEQAPLEIDDLELSSLLIKLATKKRLSFGLAIKKSNEGSGSYFSLKRLILHSMFKRFSDPLIDQLNAVEYCPRAL